MAHIRYRIVSSEKEAEKVWSLLSPHKTIDDEWTFRYLFSQPLKFPLRFYTAFEGENPVALLPLQLNTRDGLMPPYAPPKGPFLEIFGGDDTDDNTILVRPRYEFAAANLLRTLPDATYLAPLRYSYIYSDFVKPYTYKYILPLEGYASYEEYLNSTWGKSSRKKIRQQMRNLYNNNKIEVIENNYEDLDVLFDLNTERFQKGSSFNYEYRRNIFREIIKRYNVLMLTVLVNGKKSAVSYGILHKNAYIGMNAGADSSVSNLGKLLALLQIDKAIQKGAFIYDAGKGSGVWKEEFKFKKIPQYIVTGTSLGHDDSRRDYRSQPTLAQ